MKSTLGWYRETHKFRLQFLLFSNPGLPSKRISTLPRCELSSNLKFLFNSTPGSCLYPQNYHKNKSFLWHTATLILLWPITFPKIFGFFNSELKHIEDVVYTLSIQRLSFPIVCCLCAMCPGVNVFVFFYFSCILLTFEVRVFLFLYFVTKVICT